MRLTRVPKWFALFALAMPVTAAHAQRYWLDDRGKDAIRLDFGLPFLKGDDSKFFTGTMVPSLGLRSGEGFRVEADIPVARAGIDNGSSLRLGNPLIQLRIGYDDKAIAGILGMRLPAARKPTKEADEIASSAGQVSNYDDFEAYAPNLFTIRGGVEYHKTRPSGFMFGARGTTSLQMSVSGDPGRDSEAFLDYGVRAGYEGEKALAYVSLTGRYLVTAPYHSFTCDPQDTECDPKGFNERTVNAATGTFELRGGRFRPRVSLRIPFDKFIRDISGATLHVGVALEP